MTPTFREAERHGVRFLRWTGTSLPEDLVAAFSTRAGGVSRGPYATLNLGTSVGDRPAAVAENRARYVRAVGAERGSLLVVAQEHGRTVLPAEPEAARPVARTAAGQALLRRGRADGLVTTRGGRFLLTFHADCLPVFLVDPDARVAALVHAGWRGTVAGAALAGVDAAVAAGARRERLLAGVGPGVGPCCYEVDVPVMRRVRAAFGTASRRLLAPRGDARALLDLWEANRLQLQRAGLPAANVGVAGLCTRCRDDLFFSHRRARGRPGGRMLAVLGWRAA